MSEIDHEYTDELVCPHCGYTYLDSHEFFRHAVSNHVAEIECEHCNMKFSAEVEYSATYCTEKI